jgi:hypothetical protein
MDSVIKQNEGVNLTFVSNTHTPSSMFYVLLISIFHAYHPKTHHILSCSFSLKDGGKKKDQVNASLMIGNILPHAFRMLQSCPCFSNLCPRYGHPMLWQRHAGSTKVETIQFFFYKKHLKESPIINKFIRELAPLRKGY